MASRSLRPLIWIALLWQCAVSVFAQVPYMVKDLNDTRYDGSYLAPGRVTVFNGQALFSGTSIDKGYELWTSDGTLEGTHIAVDFNEGVASSQPTILGVFNGQLVMAMNRSTGHGAELWAGDGTLGGTHLVKDITPGGGGTSIEEGTVEVNGLLFFEAKNQLWRTDLTSEGTFMVADVSVAQLVAAQDKVFFTGSENGVSGLWAADGAAPGATHLLDGNVASLTAVGQDAWFSHHSEAGNQPWKSDGTQLGTEMIKQVQDSNGTTIPFFAAVNGSVYFPAKVEGQVNLWVSDGTASGTLLGVETSGNRAINQDFHVSNNRLFFSRDKLYVTDGTQAGTEILGSYSPSEYYETSSAIYFKSQHDLVKTDGTAAGTQSIWEINSTSWFGRGVAGDLFYFTYRSNLWVADGDTVTSLELPGSSMPGLFWVEMAAMGSSVVFFSQNTRFNGAMHASEGWETNTAAFHEGLIDDPILTMDPYAYYFATTEDGDSGLWRWNGSETTLLLRHQPGGFPGLKAWNQNILFNTDHNDPHLYHYNTVTGQFIYMGEQLIPALRDPDDLAILGDNVITGVSLPGYGTEPVSLSMDTVSLNLIADINPTGSSYFDRPVVWEDAVYFAAADSGFNRELWRTDGTEKGTVLVKEINPGTESSSPYIMQPLNGGLLFFAKTEAEGLELWRTDGTEAGTVLVKDTYPGPGHGAYGSWVYNNNLVYFTATDPQHGAELWVTDGTEAGTVMVKDIYPGPMGSGPRSMAAANGKIYFSATDGVHGHELWESDGTSAGTFMIRDSRPGAYGLAPRLLTPADGTLFFIGDDGLHGDELWAIRATPHAVILADAAICTGATQTAGIEQPLGDEASYVWNVQNGTLLSGQGTSQIQFTANSTDDVVLDVMITVNGVASSDVHILTAHNAPPAAPGAITPSETPCPYDQITLSVPTQLDAVSYEWTLPPGAIWVDGEDTATPVIQVGETGGLVEVRAVNGCGQSTPSTLDLVVTPLASPAYAGEGLVSCNDTIQLAAALPEAGLGTWRILSGHGGQILEPNNPHSPMTGLAGETYTLEWTVELPPCTPTSDTTQVVFTQPVEPAHAGPDAVVCGLSLELNGNQPSWGVGRWNILSGSGGTLSDPNHPQSQFSGQVGEVYVLEWMVRGKPCDISTDQVVIQFDDQITADAGEDRCLVEGSSLRLNGGVTGGQGSWSVRSGPDLDPGQFQDIHHPRSLFTPAGGAGYYELVWSVSSGHCQAREDAVRVSVTPQGQLPRLASRIPAVSIGNSGSDPDDVVIWNDLAFFSAQNQMVGRELWVSQGTDTRPVADIFPGALTHEGPQQLTPGADALYFTAFDLNHGRELWRTDGTEAGTRLVLDLVPGPDSSQINHLTAAGDLIYFTAPGEDGETYLWRSDGTEPGTFPFISEETLGNLNFSYTIAYNGSLILGNGDVWVIDGTLSGSHLISYANPSQPVLLNGALYFSSSNKFYRWDGTQLTAQKVFEHPDLLEARGYTSMGNHLFFVGRTYEYGWELWRTDGTLAGTLMVRDIAYGQNGLNSDTILTTVNNRLFFNAYDGLWSSDGTHDGTLKLANLEAQHEMGYNNKLWFQARPEDSNLGLELFTSDGTPEGTGLFMDLEPGFISSQPKPQVVFNNELIFLAETSGHGREPWTTDGTQAGTRLLEDVQPEEAVVSVVDQVVLNDLLIFTVDPLVKTLWRSDGTEAGTFQIEGPESVEHFYVFNDLVFFSADGPDGVEPWITDGSPGGTIPLADITSGDSLPMPAAQLDDHLYFIVDRFTNEHLWRTDGTPGGTELAWDFGSGADPQDGAAFDGYLFFSAKASGKGHELWRYNPANQTAQIWFDLTPGSTSSWPEQLMAMGDRLFFTVLRINNRELWSTDGTVSGTEHLEGPILPIMDDAVSDPVALNGILYFHIEGRELWRTNGSQSGTWLIEDFQENEVISELTTHGGRLYFVENRPELGDRLLRSDGTWGNAHPVMEGSSPNNLTSFEDKLFFTAHSPETGRELWQTDGFCTVTTHDRNPGAEGSLLDHFAAGENRMFYFAHDPEGASDLMVLEDPFINLPDPAFRDLILNNHDTNNDQRLSKDEAAAITSVNCFDQGVVTLKGVESMPNLTTLRAANNHIGSLGPVAANPFLGTRPGDRIDVRSNLINVDDCTDISLLNQRRLAAPSIFQLDPQKPQHGIPTYDQWPEYNVIDMIFGTLLDPGPIVCE